MGRVRSDQADPAACPSIMEGFAAVVPWRSGRNLAHVSPTREHDHWDVLEQLDSNVWAGEALEWLWMSEQLKSAFLQKL